MGDKEPLEKCCNLYLMSMETDVQSDLKMSQNCQNPEAIGCGLKQELAMVSHLITPELPEDPDQDLDVEIHESFPCQFCERHFTSKQGLERHIHIHTLAKHHTHIFKCKYCNKSFGSKIGRRRHERRHENAKTRPGSIIKAPGPVSSALQSNSTQCALYPSSSNASVLPEGDQAFMSDEHGALEGSHACKYCKKVFSTHTNMQRHQRRIHERFLRFKGKEAPLLQDAKRSKLPCNTSQQDNNTSLVTVLANEGDQEEQYMLDISGNISENLSFYIDGKIVSTSTVSGCEVVEVNSGCTTLVGLDAVIINPAQISQTLKVETATCTGKELPGQPLPKRRTATPPLLPQIKTELETESVLSSSQSSIVSSLIGSLLPQNTESNVIQRERTVYLSPKLKQLLQKQDGLKPTLALITEGQKLCSPLSLTVLPAGAGRFKRRTGSPPNSPQPSPTLNAENTNTDLGLCISLSSPTLDTECISSECRLTSKDESEISTSPPVENTMTHVLPEGWSPMSGGSSCNQQPLDLSNAFKKCEVEALGEAVLDLSVPRKSTVDSEAKGILVPQPLIKKKKPNTSMLEKVLMNEYANLEVAAEQGDSILENSDTPLVTDLAIASVSEKLPTTQEVVFGLTLPSAALSPSPSCPASITMQSTSPCTIALASPTTHPVLVTAPSLITVLAPPTSSSCNSINQSIQVFSPTISPNPFVICTENSLNSAECELSTTLPDWNTTNSSSLLAISKPLDPNLNLQGHVFLTDHTVSQIALNTTTIGSPIGFEVPTYSPALTLTDSLINSFNVTKTVLIECTVALESPEKLLPSAITVQENTVEPTAPAQIIINNLEQNQRLSLPNDESVDSNTLASSIEQSTTLPTMSVTSEISNLQETISSDKAIIKEESNIKVVSADISICPSEMACMSQGPSQLNESSDETLSKLLETFTKDFMCNVCDKLFHSMKELGNHVSEHSDKWPYKCEFCVLLFGKPSALLEHRSTLHGVGTIYICCACTKEFAYLCNLKHHQKELHPGQECTYTEEENGKLRSQNYNNSKKGDTETLYCCASKAEGESDDATEELFTTIKIMASEVGRTKGLDVRLGINQHYPSFKPPPFPYHNRTPAASVASATNFTTHNIPQTFSTAIRCTKCGKGFVNMPELHKHILSCANASDKRRYTPKKNPIPLRTFAKAQNGVLSSTNSTNGQNALQTVSQINRPKLNQQPPAKLKLNALNKRKKRLVQRAISQRSKSSSLTKKVSLVVEEQEIYVCPHCRREFTYRRSRTKHMAVCPKKPTTQEAKKRKDGCISYTKENNGHLRRGIPHLKVKLQGSDNEQKSRAHSSRPAKMTALLPAPKVLSNKKSKTIIAKANVQPQQEAPKITALSLNHPFNSPKRQGSRMQYGVQEIPFNIKVVKSRQQQPNAKEHVQPSSDSRGRVGGPVTRSLQQVVIKASGKEQQVASQEPPRKLQDPSI